MVSGGYSGGETPVPIPNTEVKTASADGTWGGTPWESRSPPEFLSALPPRTRLCGGSAFFASFAFARSKASLPAGWRPAGRYPRSPGVRARRLNGASPRGGDDRPALRRRSRNGTRWFGDGRRTADRRFRECARLARWWTPRRCRKGQHREGQRRQERRRREERREEWKPWWRREAGDPQRWDGEGRRARRLGHTGGSLGRRFRQTGSTRQRQARGAGRENRQRR